MANSESQSFANTYKNIGTKTIFSNIDVSKKDELKQLIDTISENNDPNLFIIFNKSSVSNKFSEIILYDPFYVSSTGDGESSDEFNTDKLSIFVADR